MSKNISIKINSGKETAETVKLNTAANKLVIKAQPNVNYELVDDSTQFAPDEIQTKRVGDDLHIAFEGTDIQQNSDLVLEGYYTSDNTELLVGMAENGQYYAYVPQSGEPNDAVTLLADQMFAPQALGGEKLAAAFWAFNPNWLWAAAGVAAVGGIIAAASGSHGGSSHTADNETQPNTPNDNETSAPSEPPVPSTPSEPMTPPPAEKIHVPHAPSLVAKEDNPHYVTRWLEATPPDEEDVQSIEITYTDFSDNEQKVIVTKGEDGTWNTDTNEYIQIDAKTGKVSISNIDNDVPVKAESVNSEGVHSKETKIVLRYIGRDHLEDNPDAVLNAIGGQHRFEPVEMTLTPPTVEASTKNGSVKITVPNDTEVGDQLGISMFPEEGYYGYVLEGFYTPSIYLRKNEDGSWTSDHPDYIPDIPAGENSTIIPEDKVYDHSTVLAALQRGDHHYSPLGSDIAGINTDSPKVQPVPGLYRDYNRTGDVIIGLPTDTREHDAIELTIMPDTAKGSAETVTITLTKQEDGSWLSNNETIVSSVKAESNVILINRTHVEDFSNVDIVVKTASGIESAKISAKALMENPVIQAAKDSGDVILNLPEYFDIGNAVSVQYTNLDGETKISFITKQADGSWVSENNDPIWHISGNQATLDGMMIKDNTPVSAQQVHKDFIDEISTHTNYSGELAQFFDTEKASVGVVAKSGEDHPTTPDLSHDTDTSLANNEHVNTSLIGSVAKPTLTDVSNVEKIAMDDKLNNLTLNADDVQYRHSATAIVDNNGNAHNNVLIVNGTEADKVTLSGISTANASSVDYKGNTYNVYSTGSNELWVDTDIAVA